MTTAVRRDRPRHGRGSALLLAFAILVISALTGCVTYVPRIPAAVPGQSGSGWHAKILKDHPLVGRVWAPSQNRFVAPARLIDAAVAADFVLLGEQHDNVDHHRIQSWVLKSLMERGKRPAVVFEMLSDDQQVALSRFLNGNPRSAAGLGIAVGWSQTAWPNWAIYQPIADAALMYGMPILPGGFPRSTISRMVRMGRSVIGESEIRALGLDVPVDAASRATIQQAIAVGHLGVMPANVIGKIVDMQIAKDAKMARATVNARRLTQTDSAVLIAGTGHVRSDVGVPKHLRRSGASTNVISIGLMEVKEELHRADEYVEGFPAASTLPFDFVWFTPKMGHDDEDELKERIERSVKKLSQ
ncbi:MAG: hypothetical protein COW30_08435 [Rhodospirillales bacterium CG15_BIG_FIL_POST_REV_8_21_14_020_66_15]|nr:MAG: hypothetical protein COW30_08435 [Rhodospirillales bacterium CG15_BIG_FIL_POST_REV_8_21_14_020_66_15]